jgi:PAS domain S-box-containing protein
MYAMPERNNPTAERSAGRLAEGLASAQGMPKQSEDLYRSLVENVPDYAIYLLDPRGLVATWNQGAENSTGYTAEEVIGQSFRMFFLLADAEAGVPERELEAAAQEGCFETSAWRRRKDAGALNFISSSSSKFERLIDALLRLSRQGRQVYQRSQVDVSEVVAGIAAGLKPMIDEAGAVVEVGPLPHCYADPAALGQVFSILISNALKYRDPQRQLRMEVGGTEDDRIAHYWIRDNGLGIPEAGKERLFQVFQRLHPQHASGEGMSLAIAHRIVERHEGKIWAESREGEETTFNLTLPRCAQPHPPGDQP